VPARAPALEPKQARSVETRRRLLDAAVEELLQHGYTGFSAAAVARRAGVSRGAQQNHFPHKQTFVMEAVRHLARLQREELQSRVDQVPRGRARVQTGLDVLFEAYSGPLFAAVLELSLASRDDPDLHEVVLAEERATTDAMHETATTIFGDEFPADREQGRRWATALSAIRGLAVLTMLGHPAEAVGRQWAATRRQLLELLG
jgi:AcrR family transcriptional regulator